MLVYQRVNNENSGTENYLIYGLGEICPKDTKGGSWGLIPLSK
jgi:hypothetical protein